MVSQAWSVAAVQAHAPSVRTETLPSVCPGPKSTLSGVRPYVQGDAPADCRTLTRTPAMSSEPVLGAVAALAAVRNRTTPAPLPWDPSMIVIHDTSVFAVQAHPAGARRPIVSVCSPAGYANDERSRSTRQAAGSCVISADCDPNTIAPRRAVPAGFAATVYRTVPAPCPSTGDASVIHATEDDTDQEHSRAEATARLPLPPLAGNAAGVGVAATPHRAGDGETAVLVDVEPHAEDAAIDVKITSARSVARMEPCALNARWRAGMTSPWSRGEHPGVRVGYSSRACGAIEPRPERRATDTYTTRSSRSRAAATPRRQPARGPHSARGTVPPRRGRRTHTPTKPGCPL